MRRVRYPLEIVLYADHEPAALARIKSPAIVRLPSRIYQEPDPSSVNFFRMDPAPELPPHLTRILLQVAASRASLLAFAADGCDDDDIPSLALMRPVKLQSKYRLSHQQALDFASLCSAQADTAPPLSLSPAASLPVQFGVLPSGDVPEIVEVDLDSILVDNNEPPMKLNPRAGSSSPRRWRSRSPEPPLPPIDPGAVLRTLNLNILRRLVSFVCGFMEELIVVVRSESFCLEICASSTHAQPALRLGGGGFGDVYLCRNVSKSVDCAVKIVRQCASDAESEAQKQAQCSHPNVVRLDRVHYSPQAQVRVGSQ